MWRSRSAEEMGLKKSGDTARGFALRRQRMVDRLRKDGIGDERVLEAMRRVPRHLFVAEALRTRAYENIRLPIGQGQTISQPWTVARMSELLRVEEGARILEIGAGSGYQAAVLGAMGARVFSVERHAPIARRAARIIKTLEYWSVSIKHFDGTYGWAAEAPYDRIIVTAMGPEVPEPLTRQLRLGGRLVMPLSSGKDPRLVVVERETERWKRSDHGSASFVPLIGKYGYERNPTPDP